MNEHSLVMWEERRLSTKKQQKSQNNTLNMCLYGGQKKRLRLHALNANEIWPKSSNTAIISPLRPGQTGKSSSTKDHMTRNFSCSLYSAS